MARLVTPYDSLPIGKPSHAQTAQIPRQNPPSPAVPTDIQAWLTDQIKQNIPFSLHSTTRKRFLAVARAQEKGWGWYYAKIWLTDTIDTMTAHTSPAVREVGIDANNERITTFAKMYADSAQQHMKVSNAGLTYAEAKLGHSIQGETLDSQLARIQDSRYWKREIRKVLRPWRDLWHLYIAPEYIKYASKEAITEYNSMMEAGKKWAESHEMIAPDGRTFKLPTPNDSAINNYAQLVAVSKGIETLAAEQNMTAEIITLTLDTEYHATTTYGGPRKPNKHYDKALTPRQGHRLLNKQWSKFRSAIKRRKINTFWILGAQPHNDETPHWHLVMWSHENDKQTIKELIYKYFKTNDNPKQIDIQSANSESGASSYAMRMLAYITRQVSTENGDSKKDIEEAIAASAWSSMWGIRRFRTNHTATTMWKLARNDDVKSEPEGDSEKGKSLPDDMYKAAKSGDYATFYKLKNLYQCKILYVEKVGRYGDSYKSPRGIEYTALETGEIRLAWKQTDWTLTRLPEKIQSNQVAYSYLEEPRHGKSLVPSLGFPDFKPNSDPPEHWTEPELAEWAEFLEYRTNIEAKKNSKTA